MLGQGVGSGAGARARVKNAWAGRVPKTKRPSAGARTAWGRIILTFDSWPSYCTSIRSVQYLYVLYRESSTVLVLRSCASFISFCSDSNRHPNVKEFHWLWQVMFYSLFIYLFLCYVLYCTSTCTLVTSNVIVIIIFREEIMNEEWLIETRFVF